MGACVGPVKEFPTWYSTARPSCQTQTILKNNILLSTKLDTRPTSKCMHFEPQPTAGIMEQLESNDQSRRIHPPPEVCSCEVHRRCVMRERACVRHYSCCQCPPTHPPTHPRRGFIITRSARVAPSPRCGTAGSSCSLVAAAPRGSGAPGHASLRRCTPGSLSEYGWRSCECGANRS